MLAETLRLEEVPSRDSLEPRDSTAGIVRQVEAMLAESYGRCEGPDEWWDSFAAFYQSLDLDDAARIRLNTKLDWIFCSHGETEWPAVRQRLASGTKVEV